MVARTRIVRIRLRSRLLAGDNWTRTVSFFEALNANRFDPRRGSGRAPEAKDFCALVSVRAPVPSRVGAVSLRVAMPVAPAVILRALAGMVSIGARSGTALATRVGEFGTIALAVLFCVLVDGVVVALGVAGALIGGTVEVVGVATVKARVAGVVSVLPAVSVARTENVCWPSGRLL